MLSNNGLSHRTKPVPLMYQISSASNAMVMLEISWNTTNLENKRCCCFSKLVCSWMKICTQVVQYRRKPRKLRRLRWFAVWIPELAKEGCCKVARSNNDTTLDPRKSENYTNNNKQDKFIWYRPYHSMRKVRISCWLLFIEIIILRTQFWL